jgi:hypothetical protein
MNIQMRNGLLFTSIKLTYKGLSKVIENIVIDTGAAETIISPDIVEEIGIIAESKDTVSSFYGVGGSLHNFFSKRVDKIDIENIAVKDAKLDFGVIDPSGEINGLLGLDILVSTGAIIDLKRLELEFYRGGKHVE